MKIFVFSYLNLPSHLIILVIQEYRSFQDSSEPGIRRRQGHRQPSAEVQEELKASSKDCSAIALRNAMRLEKDFDKVEKGETLLDDFEQCTGIFTVLEKL